MCYVSLELIFNMKSNKRPDSSGSTPASSRAKNPERVSTPNNNMLTISLTKEVYTESENVKGYVNLMLSDTFFPKKLQLSVFGELSTNTSSTIKRVKSLRNDKDPNARPNSRQTIQGPSLTNTMTVSKRPLSRFWSTLSNKVVPEEEKGPPNREIFVHFNIPLFTFKTHKLRQGHYKFPFQFALSPMMMASFNYNNKGFQFSITYWIYAELEEDKETETPKTFSPKVLSSKKEFKISKTKELQNQEDHPITIMANMKIPSLLCFSFHSTPSTLTLQNSIFQLGDRIKFRIEFTDFQISKHYQIQATLTEEITTFSDNHRELTKFPLKEVLSTTSGSTYELTTNGKGCTITGEIPLPENLLMTINAPNLDIEHSLELNLAFRSGCSSAKVKYSAPIQIKPKIENNQNTKDQKDVTLDLEDTDLTMVMPLSKFKLEEKYNFLSKTAKLLNGNEDDDNWES